jgi:hypothetical protein
MNQGASPAPECIARLDHSSTTPAVIVSLFGRSCASGANRLNWSAVTGESTSPGEDPTGASAEREGGFDPQSNAELAQGEYKVQRSKGGTGTTRQQAPPSRGVARGCAKDPTDNPAELDVLF